nr:hypothetical protein [Rhodococcus sp. (in: high G+C Gram-positive bacteria)]
MSIGNAIELDIVELVDGSPTALSVDGHHGIVKPNAIFINGQQVLGPRDQTIELNGLTASMDEVLEVRLTMYVSKLTMSKQVRSD